MASAAVATQPPQQHLGAGPTSRTSSPMDNKKATLKQQDTTSKTSPSQTKSSLPESQPTSVNEDSKPVVQVSEPLAPPPRPAPTNATETPDYFSALHNNTSGIGQEFNPFEQSFGAPSTDTPGKNLLPPVASLTSPAIPGTSSTGGYNWQSSLRSGPLSPAMLAGPQQGDYFDSIGRGFPTPNESSLRTGLTPGGGGSMFPAPSPNSQALYNSLASGGATPGTLDFHRTAMNAAARNKNTPFANTSNPQESGPPNNTNMDAQQHDATDAANGLFMLAKGGQGNNQFSVPNQNPPARNTQDQKGANGATSPGDGDSTGSPEGNNRSTARGGRGKKTTKAEPAAKNSRKSEATPKGSNKRSKGNSGVANVDPALDPHDDDDDDDNSDMDEDLDTSPNGNPSGKKMTDEEKRRNFLERNRVAALKCRQRKKQWLANLQAKVEMYSAENDSLNSQVAQLHEEIRNLRTLMLQHKDCNTGHAQGIGQFLNSMQDPNGFANQHVNPYAMPMPNGQQMQAGMQRS